MSDDLRTRLEHVLANTAAGFVPTDFKGLNAHGEEHGGHGYHGACALCRGEIGTLVDAVMAVLEDEEADLAEQMRHRKLGAYRLHWKSGGSSIAAVGMLHDGSRWFAPANWSATERGNVVSTEWERVKRVELIEAYRYTDRMGVFDE